MITATPTSATRGNIVIAGGEMYEYMGRRTFMYRKEKFKRWCGAYAGDTNWR